VKSVQKTEMQAAEDIAVKERDDGSALAAMDDHKDPFEGSDDQVKAEDGDDDGDGDAEGFAEGGEAEGDSEEDREAIRAARREERRLKKDLTKQREVSAKHKISALERRNETLERRLAQVENAAVGFQFAQIDRLVEDESTRVEYAKMKATQAAQAGDVPSQMEYMEQFYEAKNKLAQIQLLKQRQIEEAKKPRNNVPNPATEVVQENATQWLNSNRWYDPSGKDTDSRIAKVIDNALASEGWDPADPEYWDELDNRLKERLPHRYTSKMTGGDRNRRSGTSSGRTDVSGSAIAKNTFTLSRDRVQALKDAGMWDDPSKRAKAIRSYADFDRKNRVTK
jgi:hypothetical protein